MNIKNGLTGERVCCSAGNDPLFSDPNTVRREREAGVTALGALVLGGVVAVAGYVALRRRHARAWLGLTALAGVLLFRAVGGL